MKYCQGPECHTYHTKDRIRGHKGDKHYATRRRSQFYYGKNNFCDQRCLFDWFKEYGTRAIDHFGRVTEAKRTDCDNAWYKDYTWGRNGNHEHYFKNDLLGQRIPITREQYDNPSLVRP